ncbi:spore germination protein-like protein [Alkalihalophilus pseudofirmus OF4]|uniref:Spore germination protein-like protein n=1 Tax=Alkalihalophilus pseudofirmus (strain ATCC BAA-2126 / JCM 17055 / OF4) TaxID=398511 RepID=D3FSB2_ALKPO|nr:hypothetical protein [Alkalihalophilus pseudofirmus]ADC51747.1 spore germination protein-like protein [Alkalihalophilus pseudofirmus OF4]
MKMLLLIGMLLLVLAACQNSANEREDLLQEEVSVENVETDPEEAEGDAELTEKEKLLKKADTALLTLSKQDWPSLSKMTHPDKGLTFSFYAAIGTDEDNDVTFTKEEAANLGNDTEYIWGYDHGDQQFIMTAHNWVTNYLLMHQGVSSVDYTEVTYNDSIVESGGMINTIADEYPEAKYVEYYSPPSDIEFDWQALRFVFEEKEGEWYLVAIVRDVYSP